MSRQRKVICIVGNPGTGKTSRILDLIKSQGQRVLIYDINNEIAYDPFPEIKFRELMDFSGPKKIFDSDEKKSLYLFNKYLKNCLLILEDANYYVQANKESSPDLWKILVSRRHKGLDVCLTFHSLARVPPWLFEMTNMLILLKTAENPKRVLAKIPNYEKVLKSWERVQAHPNKFHYEIVNVI